MVHVSSLWKAFAQQFANAMNRATNGFFFMRGRFYIFIDDGWPLRALYYGNEGTLAKGDEGGGNFASIRKRTYEGWNRRDRSMATQQGWFHRSDFDPFAVDESTQRLHVGRPGGTSRCRVYVSFVILKTLVDLLHLPVPKAPVKGKSW